MKRIAFILSMLFCITAFANNSYADCPSITPDTTAMGFDAKLININVAVHLYIFPYPFEYNGACFAPFAINFANGGGAAGFMANYPAGTSTDISYSYISQILECCSQEELLQMLQYTPAFETALNQSYGETIEFSPVGDDLLYAIFSNLRQRCPITCDAGTVLQTDVDDWKMCDSCPNDQCCLTEQTTYTLSDYKNLYYGEYMCPVSGGSTPARSPLRVAAATHNAGENALVSAAYARGAYNANVANINNAIEYMEDSSVATINSAKVSADNVSLSVNGFTPSGTVSVNSSNATVSGTFNVPTTVALMDSWGSNTTTNATLGGIQQANITNGGISGLSATFTGTASGNLSGTGSFSNASVHVDGWRPVNPQ